MNELATRYKQVLERIRVAEENSPTHGQVALIAVSKFQPVEAIRALYDLGQRDFGENYVQELVKKAGSFKSEGITDIRWHFIGNLQSNKVKTLLPHVASVHSVDSLKLAQEISKRWPPPLGAASLAVFLHVNIDSEETKSGVPPTDAATVAKALAELPGLRLEGLMCIPKPFTEPPPNSSEFKNAFHRLRELERSCRPYTHGKLSMGMSDDFELAIQEGATHIRVGTSLFGKRWSPPFG